MSTPKDASGGREFSTPLEALHDIRDLGLRSGVINLFDMARSLADAGSVDIVVLSARRLACLYHLVVNAGFDPITSAAVVSDRFFDVGRDWNGKRILILDDSVVVGTTLFRLNEQARELVGPEGSVRSAAVCVDVEQQASYLLAAMEFTALNERRSAEVDGFATDVVKALFRNGIPFFSDFPVTAEVEVDLDAWTECLSDKRWYVADVTAPLIKDDTKTAFVHVPTTGAIDDTLRRLHPSVGALVESFKVRSYVSTSRDLNKALVRLVPIALVRPARMQTLDAALTAIGEQTGSQWLAKLADCISGEAKHRLLQMFVSTVVLNEAMNSKAFDRCFGAGELGSIDSLPMSLYFGSSSADFLACAGTMASKKVRWYERRPEVEVRFDRPTNSPLLAHPDLDETLWIQRELIATTDSIPKEPEPGELSKVGLIFFHSIAAVFGFIDGRYEKPQRARIRKLGSVDEYLEMFAGDESRVLNQGLTLRELTECLAPESLNGPPWGRSIVSLGVDIGNDLGIIVPATQTDEKTGVIYRCYRLGETAPLAAEPLPLAARSRQWDPLAQAVATGFPMLSTKETLKVAFASKQSIAFKVDDEALERLRSAIIKAIPSTRLAGRYAGTVTSIAGDHFDADVVREPGGDAGFGTFQVAQIDPAQRVELREGVDFFWTLYQREDSVEPESRIRLVVRPPFDRAAMKRAATLNARLGDAE